MVGEVEVGDVGGMAAVFLNLFGFESHPSSTG